jgi:light-regulated signal transduction histidine kinase (bacteriophytochrome)
MKMIERLVHEHVPDRDDSSLYRIGELAALTRYDLSADLNSEICTFMRSLAHAMRSPIWVADAFSHMLEEDASSSETTRERISHIRVAVARLLCIVNGIEQLGRSTSQPIAWKKVELGEAAGRVFQAFQQREPSSSVDFCVTHSPFILADPGLIETALHHLVENAFVHVCRTDSPKITVGVAPEPPDDIQQCGHVLCCVSDNGPGFGEYQPEELFALFGHANSSQKFEVDGIGLAVARRIIYRHGGKMWVEESPGRGTTVFFSLPDAGLGLRNETRNSTGTTRVTTETRQLARAEQ